MLGKRQIFSWDHFEQECVHLHYSKIQHSCPYGHFIVTENQIVLFYLLRAGDIPGCEGSGDGSRLISFSLSLCLLSVGVKDTSSCLGGSTSSSFSEVVTLEGDIPAKEIKGKRSTVQYCAAGSLTDQLAESDPHWENGLSIRTNIMNALQLLLNCFSSAGI